ncbi:MAG: hypothetical protein ACHQU0_01450 [Candidatus Paceibacteria bacterium]
MNRFGSYLARIAMLTVALLFLTPCANAQEIIKPDVTGHFDLTHAKVFQIDECPHEGIMYTCLRVLNGKEVYVMVFDKDGNEVFQLKQMPDGGFKQIWPLGPSI